MSDSISKRLIQDVLIERISNLNAEGEKSIQTARELIRFKRFVDGLTPYADRPTVWIPVSERLPGKNKEVLISCEWGVDIGQYDADGWRSEWINHYDDDSVLAWMPLPEPYKGGDDE